MELDPSRTRGIIALSLCLLSILTVRSASHEIGQSDHSLVSEQEPGAVPPAMAAFFRGRPEVALPEALNSTDPVWGVAAGRVAPPGPDGAAGANRTRMLLLLAGLVCGVVGAGLLGAAVVVYVNRGARSEPGSRSGLREMQGGRRSGHEVRLGA